MLHFLLQTSQPAVDMSKWSPASVEHLLETVLSIATMLASALAWYKSHRTEKKLDTNRQLIFKESSERQQDTRSVNEQITNIAKDSMPADAAKAIGEGMTKALKDTLRGE